MTRILLAATLALTLVGTAAAATIKRSDFGVNRMAPMVSDEAQLRISMEAAVPKPEAPPASADAPARKG